MKTVISLGLAGLLVGMLPGLGYWVRPAQLRPDSRMVFFTILACQAAIFGSVLGATHAIITGYRSRFKGQGTEPEESSPGFWADMLSVWSPPVGHARRDWRHRMAYRRAQIIQAGIVVVIVVGACILLYSLTDE